MAGREVPPMELDQVADTFRRFAATVYKGRSPLYESLALRVAEDPELLRIAVHARKNTALPNLFFGAVHLLLLNGERHHLASFYPSLQGTATKYEYSYAYFRPFVLEHRQDILQIIRTRLVQTNEVGRCACFVPAFEVIARQARARRLALVDVGASAGLTLLWDHYGYNYGQRLHCGDLTSAVQIQCSLHGKNHPPLPQKFSEIGSRIGVDLNPINLNDPDSILWLRALIWPEHQNRVKQLQAAIELARRNPPKIIQGDALELLPQILAAIPNNQVLCVYHSLVTSFMSQQSRNKLQSHIIQAAKKRPVFRVSMEWYSETKNCQLELETYTHGSVTSRTLANCNSHGEWLEWLEPSESHQSKDTAG